MNILICSHSFSPNVGGLETVGKLLAAEFQKAGHEVRVCTRTPPGSQADDLGLVVARNPSKAEFREQADWAEIVLQNNISLPWAIPLIRWRVPWVCGNHDWPRSDRGKLDLRGHLKLRIAQLASAQTAVSRALAGQLRGKPIIVGNPYDDTFFRVLPDAQRDRDLFFLGRLFDGKGVDTLLRAVKALKAERPSITLTIVGRGPEAEELKALTAQLGLEENVTFRGALFGGELIQEMNRHTLCVVPSRLRESFGIVALEAMACGMVAIGSDLGGVPEAIGEGGPVFPVDDVSALTGIIRELLDSTAALDSQRERQKRHLAQFTAAKIAANYLEIFRKVLER
ncbi:MAG TPA: glycosyltransferase family 4 protein [Fimbriimonadaceae bacterium]|nr:glycosyltransferase family 4 protein [Fimbriimonadaceae bacterium]